jgi:hypothetical protein
MIVTLIVLSRFNVDTKQAFLLGGMKTVPPLSDPDPLWNLATEFMAACTAVVSSVTPSHLAPNGGLVTSAHGDGPLKAFAPIPAENTGEALNTGAVLKVQIPVTVQARFSAQKMLVWARASGDLLNHISTVVMAKRPISIAKPRINLLIKTQLPSAIAP